MGINITLHFHSTYLYGTTPVMLAAGKGHTGVVDRLVHKYIHAAAQELFSYSDSAIARMCNVWVTHRCPCIYR